MRKKRPGKKGKHRGTSGKFETELTLVSSQGAGEEEVHLIGGGRRLG